MLRIQCFHEPIPPWNRTRSGPWPDRRTAIRGGSVLVGEPAALVERLDKLAGCGVEHLVIEFLASDGPELDEQMALFAERVRPKLA